MDQVLIMDYLTYCSNELAMNWALGNIIANLHIYDVNVSGSMLESVGIIMQHINVGCKS